MALKLNVKAANKKSVERPEVSAIEQATRLRDLLLKLDSLKAEVETAREELLPIVSAKRLERVRKGEEVTSINAPTLDGSRVMVVYAEKFKTLDVDNIPALQSAFGEKYPLLVDEVETISFREGVKFDGLKAAIGEDAMARLQGFLEVKRGVCPKKGVFKETARLFGEGDIARGEDALDFLEATLYSPTVRAK